MGRFGWIKAITRPQEYLKEQQKDRRNSADFQPGIRALIWFEIIMTGLIAAAAWGSLLILLALAQLSPIHLGFFQYVLTGLWAAHLGPLSWIGWFITGLFEVGLSLAFFSWFVDKSFELAFHAKERQWAQVFNLTALCTLPLVVWTLVPLAAVPLVGFVELNGGFLGRLVGSLIGCAGTLLVTAVFFIAVFRLVKAVYKQDAVRVVMAIIVAAVCAGVVMVVLMLVFNAALSVLPNWDPTRNWTQALMARALPESSDLGNLKELLAEAEALQKTEGATTPSGRMSDATINLKRMQTMVATEAQLQDATPVPATPLPTAIPTAVPVAAPTHKPSHKHVTRAAAVATPAAADEAAAPAAEPTPVPTAQPTAGSGAGQAIKDAAAGVDKAAAAKQLLHLFGH